MNYQELIEWGIKNNVSLEPLSGINPLTRIQWAIQLFHGTVTKVFDGPYNRREV